MEPGAAGLSLFNAWRHPAVSMGGMAGMGMDLTQAAYRYNQNMMEYYTCKTVRLVRPSKKVKESERVS